MAFYRQMDHGFEIGGPKRAHIISMPSWAGRAVGHIHRADMAFIIILETYRQVRTIQEPLQDYFKDGCDKYLGGISWLERKQIVRDPKM